MAPLNVNNWKEAFTIVGDVKCKLLLWILHNDSIGYGKLGYTITIRVWKISERNSKNHLSEKRTKTTTGNLSFAEVEEILTQENQGVKPPADVIWLLEHTTQNNKGVLQWKDESRSKEIHVQKQRIKELQETREEITKQLQEAEERKSKQLEQQREDMQRSMEEMKQQLL
ncbi:Nitric oxide-associated protein 1, partial [Bienertia sinuspersici]